MQQLAASKLRHSTIAARASNRVMAAAPAASVAGAPAATAQLTLVDTPVSNHGARVRFVLYKKGIADLVKTVGPASIGGGLKSPEYMRLNPQGKFPTLILPDGRALPESEVIVQYLLTTYKGTGPDLVAADPWAQALGTLVTRIHDLYITPIQPAMYRAGPTAEQRAAQIAQIAYQLDAIENTMVGGPFVAGDTITTADGALFPTVTFMTHILPKHFGWKDVFAGRPKLAAWWQAVNQDPEAAKIIAEVQGGLDAWEAADRWKVQGVADQVQQNRQLKWAF